MKKPAGQVPGLGGRDIKSVSELGFNDTQERRDSQYDPGAHGIMNDDEWSKPTPFPWPDGPGKWPTFTTEGDDPGFEPIGYQVRGKTEAMDYKVACGNDSEDPPEKYGPQNTGSMGGKS